MNRLLLLIALASCGPVDVEAPTTPQSPAPEAPQPPQPPQQQELTGLPCDVRAALQTGCAGCHTDAVYITRFQTRDDLVRLAPRLTERLASATDPMPPAAARQLTSEERALITKWVGDGLPAGECGGLQ